MGYRGIGEKKRLTLWGGGVYKNDVTTHKNINHEHTDNLGEFMKTIKCTGRRGYMRKFHTQISRNFDPAPAMIINAKSLTILHYYKATSKSLC